MTSADLTPFNFDGQAVRVVTIDGEPWFVATDVARILDYRDANRIVRRLDSEDVGTHNVGTPSGIQPVSIINESGLYEAILYSRTPGAKRFKRWVTTDVLPAIRKTGAYGAVEAELTGPVLMAKALIEAQATLASLDAQVLELTPRAEAFDAFLSTTGDYSVNEAAKILSRDHAILTGEKRLRDWMQANRWLYRDAANKPRAYQTRIDQQVLAEKAQWHYHPETGEKVLDTPQVRVTAKGIQALAKALTKVADQGEFDTAEEAS